MIWCWKERRLKLRSQWIDFVTLLHKKTSTFLKAKQQELKSGTQKHIQLSWVSPAQFEIWTWTWKKQLNIIKCQTMIHCLSEMWEEDGSDYDPRPGTTGVDGWVRLDPSGG